MSEAPATASSLPRLLLAGARPRTLPASVVPVAIGVAAAPGPTSWWKVAACMLVALALQVGTNYANDFSDGVRGTDETRVGPLRLVGSGLVRPRTVAGAAASSFAVAAGAGFALAAATSWWLLLIGASAIAAGFLYTGGPRPYGYLGLGEVFVFGYFGLVATVGSTYVQSHGVPAESWWCGAASGFVAVALLEANNVRDVAGDVLAGKRTLAVRLGPQRAPWLYIAALGGAVASLLVASSWVHWLPLVATATAAPAAGLSKAILKAKQPSEFIEVLRRTSSMQLAMGVGCVAALLAS